MANLEFCDKHNMVAYLKKPSGSEGFQEIVDFLNGSHIRYALTKNPTIYVSLIKKFWQTTTVRTVDNGEQEITATVDGKEFTVTEASVRRHLQLADVDGISVLPTTEIFDQLSLMGMLAIQAEEGEGSGHPSKPQPSPFTTQPTNEEPIPNVVSSSHQKTQTPRKALNKVTELPQTSEPIPNVPDKAVYEEWDDRVERATTTAASLDAEQASGNINRTQSTTIPNVPLPQGISASGLHFLTFFNDPRIIWEQRIADLWGLRMRRWVPLCLSRLIWLKKKMWLNFGASEVIRTNFLEVCKLLSRMVEFLGAIPINLKRNMRESEDLIEQSINWDDNNNNDTQSRQAGYGGGEV
ncbi:hypothetical protein Tco_0989350 [Tanacetum coccineum]|uniref:Xylulose kinase-1 n=1 Tax=Tanacetum coccineum TaxID=301880 RepID=A0ABQ5ETF8_9ASTR